MSGRAKDLIGPWQELAERFLPQRGDFTAQAPAVAAKRAVRGLASAIGFILEPKASNWFTLRAEDEARPSQRGKADGG